MSDNVFASGEIPPLIFVAPEVALVAVLREILDVQKDIRAEMLALTAMVGRISVNENGAVWTAKDPRS